jgi:hypothetical protein
MVAKVFALDEACLIAELRLDEACLIAELRLHEACLIAELRLDEACLIAELRLDEAQSKIKKKINANTNILLHPCNGL